MLQTFSRTGGYLLGFRIDPLDFLKKTAKEIKCYWRVANQKPNFGIISLEGNEEYVIIIYIYILEEMIKIFYIYISIYIYLIWVYILIFSFF